MQNADLSMNLHKQNQLYFKNNTDNYIKFEQQLLGLTMRVNP